MTAVPCEPIILPTPPLPTTSVQQERNNRLTIVRTGCFVVLWRLQD
jgi:hypothetical protein